MTKEFSALLSGTVLATTLFFVGCGTGGNVSIGEVEKKPFLKSNRAVKDWTWEVDATITKDGNSVDIDTYYYDNIPSKIKHFQVFIDCIPHQGFNGSDGWEVFGADYLIEDTSLFVSESDTEWKWRYLGEVSYKDNHQTGDERVINLHANSILANAIKGNSVNLYIEPYDKDWVGEYYTIPLPNVKVATESSDIDESYMKSYIQEKYAHSGVINLTEYSTYYKIAAVSVRYQSPSYIDVYNFQDGDRPTAVRIDMNKNGLVDFKSINISGDIGSETIVFRMSTRDENPVVSQVNYNLKEEKVERITIISGGAKEVLQQRLGDSFAGFNLTPNGENAIVTTRDNAGLKTYSLYDVRNAKNPTLVHDLVTEKEGYPTRWLRVLDDTVMEYTVKVADGSSRKVYYNFIENREVLK
jgi:hypothetical protein